MRFITSAAQVQQANDVRYVNVPVPEWGEDGQNDDELHIRLRSFTANELMKFTSLKGKNEKEGMARGLAMCAVDENGDLIFSVHNPQDIRMLMTKSVAVLNRCQQAILTLNEIGGRKRDGSEDNGEDDEERGSELEEAVKD